MRRLLNTLREFEWYAVIALLLLVVAVALAVWVPSLWVLAIVLAISAVVSAVFSHRT